MVKKTIKKFDYTLALRILCKDICQKVREFKTIDVNRVGFTFTKVRKVSSRYGVWASMTPLRFENGSCVAVKEFFVKSKSRYSSVVSHQLLDRQFYTLQTKKDAAEQNFLYIFSVSYPRFINLTFREKLNTIMHELYHINSSFNGDVRRFSGRNWQHGNKANYEAAAARFADEWLATNPDMTLCNFLQCDLISAAEKLGELFDGFKISKPKLIKISQEEAFKLEPSLRRKYGR